MLQKFMKSTSNSEHAEIRKKRRKTKKQKENTDLHNPYWMK